MKFAVIADIHDNLINLEKCFDWCHGNGIKAVICCGDIANFETLGIIADTAPGKLVYLVRGNMEIYLEEDLENLESIRYLGRFGHFTVDGRNIGVCHEPYFIDEVIKAEKCDLVFYGHTHKPWIAEKNGITMANPGTLGGVFQKATFAVWDAKTNKLELKLLEVI